MSISNSLSHSKAPIAKATTKRPKRNKKESYIRLIIEKVFNKHLKSLNISDDWFIYQRFWVSWLKRQWPKIKITLPKIGLLSE